MSVNIVLLVKDRPRLTEQTLSTLYANTPQDQFNVVVMNDGSQEETREILRQHKATHNFHVVTLEESIGIVGFLRNIGASASERYFGRGEFLCFIDNDLAFLPGWLDKLIKAKEEIRHQPEGREDAKGYAVLGGYRHPFHGVNHTSFIEGEYHGQLNLRIEETDAVAGYMLFMRWATFDRYGPFADNQKGVGASEDFAFCRRIVEARGHVGYVHPPVVTHTGISNTDGRPATGADQFWRVPGVLYE